LGFLYPSRQNETREIKRNNLRLMGLYGGSFHYGDPAAAHFVQVGCNPILLSSISFFWLLSNFQLIAFSFS